MPKPINQGPEFFSAPYPRGQSGVYLRDVIALVALHADMTANNEIPDDKLASRAYETADAMLKARDPENQ